MLPDGGFAPGAWGARKTARQPLIVDVMTSDGNKYHGELMRFAENNLFLKTDDRPTTIFWPNVIQFDVTTEKGSVADLSPAQRLMATGKVLLKLGFRQLAKIHFVRAIKKDFGFTETVKKLCRDARVPFPPELVNSNLTGETEKPLRYVLPTPRQVTRADKRTKEWSKAAKKIAPAMHLIETAHFRIYSTRDESDDRTLAGMCEKLYQAMCKQFVIDLRENVWIGKLPMFIFQSKSNMVDFSADVVKGLLEADESVRGYAGHQPFENAIYRYVVLGPVKTKDMDKSRAQMLLHELLVHTSTHAFVSRFINDRAIASWVDEGLAEVMATKLISNTWAIQKLRSATQRATKHGRNIDGLFDTQEIPDDWFHYGVAQSLVRYLIGLSPKKFNRFIEMMKTGKSDAEALEAVYGMTRREMVVRWLRIADRKVKRLG